MKKTLIAVLCLFLFTFASCSSSTRIMSNPSGAQVYVGGNYMGNTPLVHTDKKIAGSSSSLRIEKEGYEPILGSIQKNGDVNVGALIAGIFFLIPLFWVVGYPDGYQFELQPIGGQNFGQYVAEPWQYQAPMMENQGMSPSERNHSLREIKSLFDEGILTEAEFELEKAKLMQN